MTIWLNYQTTKAYNQWISNMICQMAVIPILKPKNEVRKESFQCMQLLLTICVQLNIRGKQNKLKKFTQYKNTIR